MTFDSLERLNLTSLHCSIEYSPFTSEWISKHLRPIHPRPFQRAKCPQLNATSKSWKTPSLLSQHGRKSRHFPCGLLIDSSSRQDSNHASKSVRGIKLSSWKLELQATRSSPNAKHPLPSENTQPLVESSGKLTQRIWSSDFIGVEIFQREKEFEREVVRGIRRTAK